LTNEELIELVTRAIVHTDPNYTSLPPCRSRKVADWSTPYRWKMLFAKSTPNTAIRMARPPRLKLQPAPLRQALAGERGDASIS
jgi:hypothetical protein